MINLIGLRIVVKKSNQIFEIEEGFKLSAKDAVLLVESFDRPAVVNTRLKVAANRYKVKSQ